MEQGDRGKGQRESVCVCDSARNCARVSHELWRVRGAVRDALCGPKKTRGSEKVNERYGVGWGECKGVYWIIAWLR